MALIHMLKQWNYAVPLILLHQEYLCFFQMVRLLKSQIQRFQEYRLIKKPVQPAFIIILRCFRFIIYTWIKFVLPIIIIYLKKSLRYPFSHQWGICQCFSNTWRIKRNGLVKFHCLSTWTKALLDTWSEFGISRKYSKITTIYSVPF